MREVSATEQPAHTAHTRRAGEGIPQRERERGGGGHTPATAQSLPAGAGSAGWPIMLNTRSPL
jgi:hypothetical protein